MATVSQRPPGKEAADRETATRVLTLGHVIVLAVVVGLFAVVWLAAYSWLGDLIWNNSFVAANRWTIPVGALFFSLLVGLAQKYANAPNVIESGGVEALKEG